MIYCFSFAFSFWINIGSYLHFAQSIKHENFASLGNIISYDFSKAKEITIALFNVSDDRQATIADNRILKSVLDGNKLLSIYKEYENTGHASFFISSSNYFMEDVVMNFKKFSK